MARALARRSFIEQAAIAAVTAGMALAGHPLAGLRDRPLPGGDHAGQKPDHEDGSEDGSEDGKGSTTNPGGTDEALGATKLVLRVGDQGPAVAALQRELLALGYWLAGTDGHFGSTTHAAVVALQKVAGLARDGVCGPATRATLAGGARPTPSTRSSHVIEVDKDRQILLVVDSGRVRTILATSTGAGKTFDSMGRRYSGRTPEGSYRVYESRRGWDHGPLGDLYRPMFFNGGIAIHGALEVPPYPASHGCCRLSVPAMDMLLATQSVAVGTRVVVA